MENDAGERAVRGTGRAWTEFQQAAIAHGAGELLVSAAAAAEAEVSRRGQPDDPRAVANGGPGYVVGTLPMRSRNNRIA